MDEVDFIRWIEDVDESVDSGENETRFDTDFDRPWFISRGLIVLIELRSMTIDDEGDWVNTESCL